LGAKRVAAVGIKLPVTHLPEAIEEEAGREAPFWPASMTHSTPVPSSPPAVWKPIGVGAPIDRATESCFVSRMRVFWRSLMRLSKLVAQAMSPIVLFLIVCAPESNAQGASETAWPTKGWRTSAPEQQGLDSAELAKLVDAVGARRQDSLLLIRHGRIVAEAYYAPFEAGIRHDLRSVTKSVIGTLTAIEIQDGFLDGVDDRVVDLFSDKQIANVDDLKKEMTVQNLLDMTSGLQWKEENYTSDESIMRMYQAPDRASFVLDQPMSDPPGAKFYYNGGNPYLLSALLTKETFKSAYDFAKYQLFQPLGISNVRWGRVDAQGVTDGESGLFLEPRDMAKIGYLYLRHGLWEDKQIIPSWWVDRVQEGKVEASYGFHYANLWWSLPKRRAYMARGRHSQLILVLPDLDIVAVMTGVMWDDEYYSVGKLIDAISRSVKSDQALPPNPEAETALAASISRAATEPPRLMPEPPETARAISGRTYEFSGNVLRVKTLILRLLEPRPSWEYTIDNGKEQPIARFAGLIGLDGAFRKSPLASYGIDAVKGRWIDDDTLEVERRILGHGETQIWVLRFDGKKIDVRFEDTDGFKTELHGEEAD
jgi:CubicO group peptidase (beta-lactamase class C family)